MGRPPRAAASGDQPAANTPSPFSAKVLGVSVEVRQSDTIDSLAGELGLPRQALLVANGGRSELKPGQVLNILLGKSSSGTLQAAETAKLEAAAVPPSSRSSAPTKRQAARAQRQQEMRQRLDTMRQERQEQQQEREEQQEPQRQRQQAEQLHHQHAEASALQDQQAAETQAGIGVDAQPPPSLLVRAGGLIRSPIGLGFAVALAAAVLGSRLLQSTRSGRAAAAEKAASSPEAVVEVAEAHARSAVPPAPSDDELLGRARAAVSTDAADGGPSIDDDAAAAPPGSGDGAAAPQQQADEGDSGQGGSSKGARYPVGTAQVDAAQWAALPYVATVREEGSNLAVVVALLGDENAMLVFEGRQDASDFAGVANRLSPSTPVVPTFHSPADLAVRAAARGYGLVFVPKGAVQFRLDYDFKRLFSDLFSNSRMLGASSTANLARRSQQESSSSAGASGAVGSSQPAHAAEPGTTAESAEQEQLWAVGLDLDYDDSSDDSNSESEEEEQPPSPAAGSRQRTSGSGGGNGSAAEDAAATPVVDVQASVRNRDGTDGAAAAVQPSNAALDPDAWRRLPFVCVPRISYTADAGAFAFLTADLALPSEEPVRHVLALADRHDAAAVQAVFLRDSSPSSRAELHIVLMTPTDAEAAALQHEYQGLTVFAPNAMRLQPGMGLEELAQQAFDALHGDENSGL